MNKTKRTVVITGAAQGIGRAIAEKFCREGFQAVLLDMNPGTFSSWVDEANADILTLKCNITDKEELADARDQALARFGAIDVLVNNAGIGKGYARIEDVPLEDWIQVMHVNLTGTFLCTQVFGKCMLDRGGSIVNIGSQAGIVPSAFRGAYSASKAGVVMLTQQLAVEWGSRKVRTNVVLPGIIKTEMSMKDENPKRDQALAEMIPSGRPGLPEDIANVVYFLASPDAGYINGESICVDGGFTKTVIQQFARANQK